ncbi:MAG: hypothetical protein IJZ24_01925, partial [Clostridia bacterium]|nr:hypothetical protein [Clostridia bacterium]
SSFEVADFFIDEPIFLRNMRIFKKKSAKFRGKSALPNLMCSTLLRLSRPKIGVLAHQAQGVGIFAFGEYLGSTPKGVLFSFLGAATFDTNRVFAPLAQNPVRFCRAEHRTLAMRRQACKFSP